MVKILPLEQFFWYANLVLKVVLLWKLFAIGLAPRYRALCFAMILATVRTMVLLPLNVSSLPYAYVYLLSQPLLLMAYIAVALEIYGQVFETYQGISILGRGFVVAAFAVSIAASLWIHVTEFGVQSSPQKILSLYLAGESALYVMLLVFLVALGLFLFWYPVPLRKNLLHYLLVFSVFFAASSFGIYMGRQAPGGMGARLGSTLRMGVDTACLVCWVFLFRREWEAKSTGVAFAVSSAHQVQVLQRLESMNQAILSVRKSA